MYDQSFNYISLSRMLRKSDFYLKPRLRAQPIKDMAVNSAVARCTQGFASYNFLASTMVRGKNVYRIPEFADEIVLRKIDKNLRKASPVHSQPRDTIVAKLKNLISESIKCNIYRLDIKSFYESFDQSMVLNRVDSIKRLSPQTKAFIRDIINSFNDAGGSGVPRGLAISATLTELVMAAFDDKITAMHGVYFYCRYVDDIIIITSGAESPKNFVKLIDKQLPAGLQLNKKKEEFCLASDSTPFKPTANKPINTPIISFEYLGYSYSVFEPSKKNDPREVVLDIASSKVKKIKTRLTKSYIDYCNNKNFELLELRLKFLTSNFSVQDINNGGYRLAGIYHNYHRIDASKSAALRQLDEYIKRATFSSHGKVFNELYCNTSSSQRRRLSTFSFTKGFRNKIYLYFSREQFMAIRECWEYA